jgi:hypothetical protein
MHQQDDWNQQQATEHQEYGEPLDYNWFTEGFDTPVLQEAKALGWCWSVWLRTGWRLIRLAPLRLDLLRSAALRSAPTRSAPLRLAYCRSARRRLAPADWLRVRHRHPLPIGPSRKVVGSLPLQQ